MTPIRALIVDDSVVIRRLVASAFDGDPDVEVVGTAINGEMALEQVHRLEPDVVTLDIEMPVMDGLETLRRLRRTHPKLPVVMFSTLTERGGIKTLEALSRGASDYVTKPSSAKGLDEALVSVREQLLPKVKGLCFARRRPWQQPETDPVASSGNPPPSQRVDVIALGCSTGGPDALCRLVEDLPGDLPVPVVVVQHMPKLFTKLFAERLDRACDLMVTEVVDGEPLRPGHLHLAPGDWHLRVVRDGLVARAALDQGPQQNFCRPAVDALFTSVAEVYGAHSLGVVLTGMGQDGRLGADRIRAAGGEILVQDKASSVVWGMPGAVAAAGLAHRILPLEEIAPGISESMRRNRQAVTSR